MIICRQNPLLLAGTVTLVNAIYLFNLRSRQLPDNFPKIDSKGLSMGTVDDFPPAGVSVDGCAILALSDARLEGRGVG